MACVVLCRINGIAEWQDTATYAKVDGFASNVTMMQGFKYVTVVFKTNMFHSKTTYATPSGFFNVFCNALTKPGMESSEYTVSDVTIMSYRSELSVKLIASYLNIITNKQSRLTYRSWARDVAFSTELVY